MTNHEHVDVIDDDGVVVGQATRHEMRAKNLRHRSVGVLVRSADDKAVLVHRRADWKDVWPGHWDLVFGGVVGAGEEWEVAAIRELSEECGLQLKPGTLRPLGDCSFADGRVRVLARIFDVRSDGPFTFRDGEVVEVDWVPLTRLAGWIADHLVCPDTAQMVGPLLRRLPD